MTRLRSGGSIPRSKPIRLGRGEAIRPLAYHRILTHPLPPARSNRMLTVIQRARKAIVAGLGAGAAAYVAALPDGVTGEEWGKIVGAALVLGFAAWAVPNKQ